MYPKYSYLACVICVLCGFVASNEPTKLKTNIFYDTVDPKCIHFFSNKFDEAYHPFEQYVDVNLVPFGNAVITDGQLKCPKYGEGECYGVKVHACALESLTKTADKIKFVVCTMNYLSNMTDPKSINMTTYPAQKCIDHFMEFNASINACIANQSLAVLEKYSDSTKLLGAPNDWPVITLNSEPYDALKSQSLVNDFTSTLCHRFETDAALRAIVIPVCKGHSTTSTPATPTTKPSTTTSHPNSAAAVPSIKYLQIVIATTLTVLVGVKLG